MKRTYIYLLDILLICLVIMIWWGYCRESTSIIFIRHAEREPGVDALNQTGLERAERLANMLKDSGATAIYTSGANRTRQTAAPIAGLLGVEISEIKDPQATIDDIFANHHGETVIVAGHSNTVPQMVDLAGGPAVSMLEEDDFGSVFILNQCACSGPTKLLRLQY